MDHCIESEKYMLFLFVCKVPYIVSMSMFRRAIGYCLQQSNSIFVISLCYLHESHVFFTFSTKRSSLACSIFCICSVLLKVFPLWASYGVSPFNTLCGLMLLLSVIIQLQSQITFSLLEETKRTFPMSP